MNLHDFNSGFKAFRRKVWEDINLRKDQHRYLLNIAKYHNFKVGEVAIAHHPRKEGYTKYGASRMFWGFFDLIALRLQLTFQERPMALFGLTGILLIVLGFIAGAYVLGLNLFFDEPFQQHFALLLLSSLLLLSGIQTFLFGFLADLIVNIQSEK
jgi:hypothetical protein